MSAALIAPAWRALAAALASGIPESAPKIGGLRIFPQDTPLIFSTLQMAAGFHLVRCAAAFAAAFMLAGCGVPFYDVPYTEAGQPTVKSIVQRIQCEIRDMVRDDATGPEAFYRPFLLNQDIDVVVAMSIEVNNTGGLNPTLSYLSPLTSFTFSGSGTFSGSRNHTFTQNLQFSVREIYLDWYTWRLAKLAGVEPLDYGLVAHDCPTADANLSGTLGIVDFVAMAANSEGLMTSSEKVFGGSIQFLITKNLSAVGPTWSLVHFKGPGGLVNLSQVSTNKITLAFAQGPNVGKKMILPKTYLWDRKVARIAGARSGGFNPAAYGLLQQMLTSSINSQLTLQNNLLLQNLPR
jgi:hypothetical protein